LLEKITYSYAWPLIESSLRQQVRFEQYGELPDRLKIKHEEKRIEEEIQRFIKRDPNDRLAFMKGLLSANRWSLSKFLVVRLLLEAKEVALPLMLSVMIDWIQSRNEESLFETAKMVALGMAIPALQLVSHIIWEYFSFDMVEVGHRAHTSLKTMLFRKNFKMTRSTNKDFSRGEINSIIMNESDVIWTFIWQGPSSFECAFQLVASSVIVYKQIGNYGLLVLLFMALQTLSKKARGRVLSQASKKRRESSQKRDLYINESFNNIKTLKLFGWESNYLQAVDKVQQEELAFTNQQLLR